MELMHQYNKRLVILGAGGHGRVCAEIARLNGYHDVVFLDDRLVDGLPIVGKLSDYGKFIKDDFFIAIGNNSLRHKLFDNIRKDGGTIVTLIHPQSTISTSVKIGKGCVVMAGTVVNTGVEIGNGVILNTSCSVDHDCKIDDFVHISVGAHIAGTVTIGQNTWIGIGAVVSNNILVTADCMIGAGAVVVKGINKSGTYIGVPARIK